MVQTAARLPLPRNTEELLIERVGDEVLVFDRVRQQAHCLNRTAALVWERCDGHTSVVEMAAELEATGAIHGGEMVAAALAQLAQARLTVEGPRAEAPPRNYSRRKAIHRLGLTAGAVLAIPIVQSIVAPSIAQAGSIADGQPCISDGQCISGGCGHVVAGRCDPS